MKATGIVRRIDNLGRFVIPKEILRNMEISVGDPMEIYVDSSKVILQKYQPDSFTADELKEALIMVCQETGREALDYLKKAKGESQ